MSTERKPGSRAARDPSSLTRPNAAPRFGGEPDPRPNPSHKGTTRTTSPKRGFKKRPKKK